MCWTASNATAPSEVLDAHEWLLDSASSGSCDARKNDSVAGTGYSQGAFGIGRSDCVSGWLHATKACLRRCTECESCKFISLSIQTCTCQWFARCDALASWNGSVSVLSGPTRRISAGNDNHYERPLPLASQDRHRSLKCSKESPDTSMAVEVTKFDNDRSLSFNFHAALQMLRRAACCAGFATLPRISVPEPTLSAVASGTTMDTLLRFRHKTCFSFAHLPAVAKFPAKCRSQHSSAQEIARLHDLCPSSQTHMQPAVFALSQYLNLSSVHTCPASFDSSQTLVAHIRRWGAEQTWSPPSSISDPPLVFYLDAWWSSKMPRLHVVTDEDEGGPVLAILRAMQQLARPPRTISIHVQQADSDLGALTCARHLAIGHSDLNALLLTNVKLESVYAPKVSNTTWMTSCDTKLWVPSRVSPNALRSPAWATLPAQRLHLSTMFYNDSMGFTHFKTPLCSSPLGASHGSPTAKASFGSAGSRGSQKSSRVKSTG